MFFGRSELFIYTIAAGFTLSPGLVTAQTLPNGKAMYQLVNGSSLMDDCPICDRAAILAPMRGSFELRLLNQGPLFLTYAVENLQFTAARAGGQVYTISGHGTFRIGGELAVQQDLALEVTIDNGFTNTLCEFTNAAPMVSRQWPMLYLVAGQSNGTPIQQYTLNLSAAPFREIWFSTVSNFQAAAWNAPTNLISAGDLLSSSGRVVKRNIVLIGKLGVQPPVPDLGLKDIDILPDGEIVFSVEQNIFSETLGQLLSQDLLSDRGRIVHHVDPDLIKNFQPTAPVPDPIGLEAVQVLDDGATYFSVQNAFGSGSLGVTLQPGDLLSDAGTIVRSGTQLLAAFGPQNPKQDVGLKAVYIWPSGEIWFATRDGFTDTNGVWFGPGDVLSDQGYLIYSNADLLAPFAPSANTNDFGLDALFVVSDVSSVNMATSLNAPQLGASSSGDILLQRTKGARVFQLEAAPDPLGPFVPAGPITTDNTFLDAGAATNQARFYRLHQW